MKQEIMIWDSSIMASSLKEVLEYLIKDGHKIITVAPMTYKGHDRQDLQKALIIYEK